MPVGKGARSLNTIQQHFPVIIWKSFKNSTTNSHKENSTWGEARAGGITASLKRKTKQAHNPQRSFLPSEVSDSGGLRF